MPLEEDSELLKENMTETYKHAPPKLEASIHFEAKHIVNELAKTPVLNAWQTLQLT